ncbi:MAG: NYN domain-containing protein, partial [Armatimonadota bacterium]
MRLGRFKAKTLTCPLCGRRFVRYEEKETDVALGVDLVELVSQELRDTAVLVSGDGDLVPAVVAARRLRSSKA